MIKYYWIALRTASERFALAIINACKLQYEIDDNATALHDCCYDDLTRMYKWLGGELTTGSAGVNAETDFRWPDDKIREAYAFLCDVVKLMKIYFPKDFDDSFKSYQPQLFEKEP